MMPIIKKSFLLLLCVFLQSQLISLEISTELPKLKTENINEISTTQTSNSIANSISTEMSLEATTDISIENSTVNANITETTTAKESENKEYLQTVKKTDLKESKRDTCPCDLERYSCDINCCCDLDCTQNDKSVFDMCIEDEHRVQNTAFCRFSEYIYKNNTPYEWEVNQNGLFCIVKSNLPHQYVKQKKVIIKNLEDARLQLRNKYTWPSRNDTELQIMTLNSFGLGDDIIYYLNNKISLMLKLPAPFFTDRCLIFKNVKFLINSQHNCYQTNFSTSNVFLNYNHYFENIIVPSNNNFTNMLNCKQKATCINITTKICYDQNCKEMRNITASMKRICKANQENLSCVNIVTKVLYDFYHNGSNGLISINLTIHLSNMTLYNFKNSDVGFKQNFQVNFYWWNQTYNISNLRSGNPGYIVGKPILIAELITVQNFINTTDNITTSSQSKTIERSKNYFSKHFLTFPTRKSGLCLHTDSEYSIVPFGYSMISKCQLNSLIDITKGNATNQCKVIQENIFNLWSISDKNISYSNGTNVTVTKLIGYFGNANSNNSEDWFEVLYEKSPQNILNLIVGSFDSDNNSITCNNICTKLMINVYHAREIFKDLENQERIVASDHRFDCINYQVLIVNKSASVNLKIEQSVMFFDITTEKIRKFADPPSFEIKLPYDFFYPFVRIASNSCKIMTNVFNILIIGIVIIISI